MTDSHDAARNAATALRTLADAVNGERDVRAAWYFRGLAARIEARALADGDAERLYWQVRLEAEPYGHRARFSFYAGWNAGAC